MTSINRRTFVLAAGAAATLGVPSRPAIAQNSWPSPTKMIVPYVAGGAIDVVARRVIVPLARELKTNVIVENRPGGATLVAVRSMVNTPKDGSHILHISNALAMLHALGAVDIFKELTPVTITSESPQALVVSGKSPYRNLQDFIKAAQANPGKLNFGHGGVGSPTHLMLETLKAAVPGGLDVLAVPYKSAGAMTVPIMSGELDATFLLPALAMGLIKKGDLRAIAVSSAKRATSLPEVGTIAEQGAPKFSYVSWSGYAVVAGTPAPIVEQLFQALQRTYKDPELRQYMESVGSETEFSTSPDEFAQLIRKVIVEQAALAKRLGITSLN